ncbi:MAG: PilN domain-containing protein [Anaerosomatales bacterium]
MVRINLLPQEILEKRRFERDIRYVIVAGLAVLAVLFVAYGLFAIQVSQRNAELQERKQTAANLQAQAEAFRIFEEKESDLEARLGLAEQALAGRVEWGRLANELSLIMPSDVWVVTLTTDEEQGVTMFARAVDSETDVPDVGHKAVAKTLVRLADLDQLSSVWLSSSIKTKYEEKPVIDFTVTTAVERPGADGDEDSVPAPPTGSGQ